MSVHVPVQRRQRAGNFILSPICPGCRQHKRPGTPVCRNCLNKLPIRMHGRLQKMLKGHFVIAYEEALELLAIGTAKAAAALPATGGLACRIMRMQSGFGRWCLVHPTDDHLRWSGSRWVGAEDGVQICNFDTAEQAAEYLGTPQDLP